MIIKLKNINRVLWELWIGIIFYGLLCQLFGMYVMQAGLLYSAALWTGIVLALVTVSHMYRSLDKAMNQGGNITKSMIIANLIRYAGIVMVFCIILLTKVFNPLVTFCGLMSVKAAAYLQPITHKLLCRKEPVEESIPKDMECHRDEYVSRT